jgi:hypothetical protein
MLFVGLGGTGGLIGAELEWRLREALCGPDGHALTTRVPGKSYLPYQLPSCLQFVYADLDELELKRLRNRVVPSDDHMSAASRTQHLTLGLIPNVDTYPDVAHTLRIMAMDYVRGWLPPAAGEPNVSLVHGADQLPTVSRAALFETFRAGAVPARRPIADAVGEIGNSGPELVALGGRLGETCDVFVAFSVAGGTGAGIFYDYLHLLGDVFQRTGFRAQVYPLVLMPSAFGEGVGGGRRAKLNAGRALLDLFRLVDDQNGRPAGADLTSRGTSGMLGVRYPDRDGVVRLLPSTIQTGFLFNGADGVERDDLHRSVVSLILSLVGGGSFTDEFVNRGAWRGVPASSGVGRRGVSTNLVASMTVPVDDLADVVASRLLARAVDDLRRDAPATSAKDNAGLVRRFASAANIGQIVSRKPPEITEPPPARGATSILSALRTRTQSMQANVEEMEGVVQRTVPNLAANFNPPAGLRNLLTDIDIFHAHRVVDGDPSAPDAVGRSGVVGFLADRRSKPPAPPGFTIDPPPLRSIKDRLLGTDKARWDNPQVRDALEEQDDWYQWRAWCIWNAAWDEQHDRWEKAMRRLRTQLKGLVDAFDEHVQAEPGEFAKRTAELDRPRAGVTFLFPPHGDMGAFYQKIFDRLVADYKLPSSAGEGEIVNKILGPRGWWHVWTSTVDRDPEAGVSAVRNRLKEEVKRLLPTIAGLLSAAVRKNGGAVGGDDDVRQFRAKINGLVPANFSPQGSGNLKVLVSYPAGGKDSQIERYLDSEIRLPKEPGMLLEFRPINADSIAVALFRTSMSVTEVPELREILHHWADALDNEQPQDFLKWRQRLGYDDFWLLTTEEDRVRILHHLLCAMWNGRVELRDGGVGSPTEIRVLLGGAEGDGMTLKLAPFEQESSWGSVLRYYERWLIDGDERFRRDFCEQLMRTQPVGVTGRPVDPHIVFQKFVDDAGTQAQLMADMLNKLPAGSRSWVGHLHDFWSTTVPAALDMPFEKVTTPVRANLRQLYEMVKS